MAFAEFFLEACLDQVAFMEGLMQPKALRERILRWAEEEIRYQKASCASPSRPRRDLVQGFASAWRGGVHDRPVGADGAQRDDRAEPGGDILAAGPRDGWQIAFPARLAPRLMPGLFPEALTRP